MNDYARYWPKIQKLNQERPLNNLAWQALRSVGVKPHPDSLYLVQLLEWALEKGKVKLDGPRQQQEFLRESLLRLGTWDPEIVMGAFEEDSEGNSVSLVPRGPINPTRLASEAVEQFHSRLVEAGQYPDQAFQTSG